MGTVLRRMSLVVVLSFISADLVAQEESPASVGEDRSPGNEAHHAGADAYAEGRFGVAEEYFREALRLSDRESVRYNLGLALEQQGKFVEAIELYEHLLALPDQQLPAERGVLEAGRARSTSGLATIEIRIEGTERGTIHVSGEDAGVVSQGSALTIRRDPGEYRIEAHDGSQSTAVTIRVIAGQHRVVELGFLSISRTPNLEPARAAATQVPAPTGALEVDVTPQRSGPRVAVWVLLGSALVAGIITAIALSSSVEAGYESGPFATFDN